MGVMTFILSVIIAIIIGTVADRISPFHMPGSWAGAVLVSFIGGWFGPFLFGTWGPSIAGFSLVPFLVGAIIMVMVVGIITDFF